MTSSGTYNFAPSVGELVLGAYRRIQIHRSAILQEHLTDAALETNLLQIQWANLGPLLWTVDLVVVPLIAGQSVYPVDPTTVMILDAFISIPDRPGAGGFYSDRIIMPLSRSEWASTPNKMGRGSVTSFWFDRLESPTITLWPVPFGTFGFLKYYRFRNIQDAILQNQTTPQMPNLWLDAYVSGLSHRLARIYAPTLEGQRETDAQKAYNVASMQGVENTPLYIAPATAPYWRT